MAEKRERERAQARRIGLIIGLSFLVATLLPAANAGGTSSFSGTIQGVAEELDLPWVPVEEVPALATHGDLNVCTGHVATFRWQHDIWTDPTGNRHLTHGEAQGDLYLEFHDDGTIHYAEWDLTSAQDTWRVQAGEHVRKDSEWTWNKLRMDHGFKLDVECENGLLKRIDASVEGEPVTRTGLSSIEAYGPLCETAVGCN